jgi:hypothetical protein
MKQKPSFTTSQNGILYYTFLCDSVHLSIEHPVSSIDKRAIFQSKTLTVKNKNKIFPKFLSPYPASSYKNPASKIETFFGSNLHTRLIIERVVFCPVLSKGEGPHRQYETVAKRKS